MIMVDSIVLVVMGVVEEVMYVWWGMGYVIGWWIGIGLML